MLPRGLREQKRCWAGPHPSPDASNVRREVSLPSLHSITSSAVASSDGGTVTPSTILAAPCDALSPRTLRNAARLDRKQPRFRRAHARTIAWLFAIVVLYVD